MSIKKNSSTGYILEVNLEYSKELHDIHNDYRLAPEKIYRQKEQLSNCCLKIANEHSITIGSVKKILKNLMSKNFVTHYRNLQQYLQLGLKFKKIHRILHFKQIDWMEVYIEKESKNKNCKT